MVEFLYRGDYTELEPPDYQTTDKDSHGSNLSAAPHAILHAAMFAVADKYNIAALGDVAKNKFEQAIKESVSDTNYFLDIIDYVYSTTPESNRGLRDLIVFQAQTRGAKIMAEPELNSRLEEIISSTPRFAMDLIQQSLHPASPPSPKRCPFCTAVMGNEANCSQCKNGTARLPWNFDRLRDPQGTHGGGGLFGNANANAHPPGSTVGDFASLLANPRSNNGLSTNTDAILHANEQISIDLF